MEQLLKNSMSAFFGINIYTSKILYQSNCNKLTYYSFPGDGFNNR